jgi:hypothetical protein
MKTWTNQEEELVVGYSFCINSNSKYIKEKGFQTPHLVGTIFLFY